MKTIKRVALKEATQLSQEEMKLVFGGSGGSGMTSCATDCGSQPSRSISNCIGTCTAEQGSHVTCSGPSQVLIKYCDGTSSLTKRT